MEPTLTARLSDYRALRHDIETSILPLATSVDGRQFTFQAPLEPLALRVGGYVVLESAAGPRLGQVLSLEIGRGDAGEVGYGGEMTMSTRVMYRLAQGEGTVLDGPADAFHDAVVRPAEREEVRAWLRLTEPTRAMLAAGQLTRAPGLGHALDAGGFDRHTFLCGQSGSGKTYALGVLLERLLLATSLRIVVLDPNSDFARITTPRADTVPDLASRYRAATANVAVHRATGAGAARLRLRLPELDEQAQAAVLRLDPIRDRDEYAELSVLLEDLQPHALEGLQEAGRPGAAELARRARNLGVDSWGVWARTDPGSTLDALEDPAVRGLVVDLGSLATHEEQALVAGAVLGRLWRRRALREPVLIVIDEAHNVCPAEPADALTALATEHAVRIAAEGRKFGLYLLTSTQRPQKVHPNVVSQCDNLVLMRMNAAADIAYAREVFSFVPASLLDLSMSFTLGQALVAGKLSSHPALVKMGPRIAEEGGADVPSTWAQNGPQSLHGGPSHAVRR
jgi:DNA helicase HerA-like ATPase